MEEHENSSRSPEKQRHDTRQGDTTRGSQEDRQSHHSRQRVKRLETAAGTTPKGIPADRRRSCEKANRNG